MVRAILSGQRAVRDGVTIDLRSQALGDWKSNLMIGVYDPLVTGGPRVVFPWNSEAMRAGVLAVRGVVAVGGDEVNIQRVEAHVVGTPLGDLDRPDHRERRLAYLQVLSPGGLSRPVDQPLVFRSPETAVGPDLVSMEDGRRALLARLENYLDTDDLELLELGQPEDWPLELRGASHNIQQAFLALLMSGEGGNTMFGYWMAKAEMEETILPAAKVGVGSRAQRAGATANAALTNRLRGDPVRALAEEDIRDNPDTMQSKCAERVADKMGMSLQAVNRLIRPLFEPRSSGRGRRPRLI